MKIIVKTLLLLLVVAFAISCSSSRKCGNKKGIKTPMGTM
jgi:hypothetical protein